MRTHAAQQVFASPHLNNSTGQEVPKRHSSELTQTCKWQLLRSCVRNLLARAQTRLNSRPGGICDFLVLLRARRPFARSRARLRLHACQLLTSRGRTSAACSGCLGAQRPFVELPIQARGARGRQLPMGDNAQSAARASVPPRLPPAPARQALQTEEPATVKKREDAQMRAAQRDPVADAEPPIIEVPNNFRARKGTHVGDGWQIGEALGTGLQARPAPGFAPLAAPVALCSCARASRRHQRDISAGPREESLCLYLDL